MFGGSKQPCKERTWVGCNIRPDADARMPTLLLRIGDRHAPLKWLDAGRAIGTDIDLFATASPMSMTGTIQGIVVWGCYMRPLT